MARAPRRRGTSAFLDGNVEQGLHSYACSVQRPRLSIYKLSSLVTKLFRKKYISPSSYTTDVTFKKNMQSLGDIIVMNLQI
jgi:hypothetical protein